MNTITLTDAQVLALAPLFAAVGVVLDGTAPAVETAPAKPAKGYRSAATKARAHDRIWGINTAYNLKLAGGTRKVSDLDADERACYDAEIKAVWAAARKTRSTKA